MFFPSSFIVSGLAFGSVVHFELICMQHERGCVCVCWGKFQYAVCEYPVFPAPFIEESALSSVCISGACVRYRLAVDT